MQKVVVLIVGAGPAGMATAACLGRLSVPYAVVEQEDCTAPLWRRSTYDRLKLHLGKEFCELPHMPFPCDAPTYLPRDQFISYLDGYAERFGVRPRYRTAVESCAYDEETGCWIAAASDQTTGAGVRYAARFLVVATGENAVPHVPEIAGMEGFTGEAVHSSWFKSGAHFNGRSVLVVGCGNSGMEIAYDLVGHAAETSIVVRSPFHVMTKEMIRWGMKLASYKIPVNIVDVFLVTVAKIWFGDLSKYGIVRPTVGPLLLKAMTGRSAVIDVGTVNLIRKGAIKVFGEVSSITGNIVEFKNGKESSFDAIVFATGYKNSTNTWLKGGEHMLDNDGLPKKNFPNHWKGENGLYCAGLARRGLAGISHDAKNIANDIKCIIDSTLSN